MSGLPYACASAAAGWGEALTLVKLFVAHGLRYRLNR